eukprot:Gb_13392 [translate_table: standard]
MKESLREPLIGEGEGKDRIVVVEEDSSEGLRDGVGRRLWRESKKLWQIAAPAILSRISMNGMNVVTQAFAGHLGDLELAAISISITVVVGLSFGFLVCINLAVWI